MMEDYNKELVGVLNIPDEHGEYHSLIAIKGEKGDPGERGEQGDAPSEEEVRAIVSQEISKVIADAPESFDTLKEISDWIATHEDSAAEMNSAIQTNARNIATNADGIASNTSAIEANAEAIQTNTEDIEELKNRPVEAGIEITYEAYQALTEEQRNSGDYYITDYPDEFANAENIPYKDTNVASALDALASNLYKWTKIATVSGTNNIQLPSTFNELLFDVVVDGAHYNSVIPYEMLSTNEIDIIINGYFAFGSYGASASAKVSRTSAKLHECYKNTNNIVNSCTLSAYYR